MRMVEELQALSRCFGQVMMDGEDKGRECGLILQSDDITREPIS